jgi:hypothetical protein
MYSCCSSVALACAQWLSSEGTRLVHPALPHATAELLGVRSLRYVCMCGYE